MNRHFKLIGGIVGAILALSGQGHLGKILSGSVCAERGCDKATLAALGSGVGNADVVLLVASIAFEIIVVSCLLETLLPSRSRYSLMLVTMLVSGIGLASAASLEISTFRSSGMVDIRVCLVALLFVAVGLIACYQVFTSDLEPKQSYSASNLRLEVVAISIGFIVCSSMIAIESSFARAEPLPTLQQRQSLLIRKDSHSIGPDDAPISIVEFGDFQCPACRKEEPVIQDLLAHYGNKVRFTFRHFPLIQIHSHAIAAAEASECLALQGRFWTTSQEFYRNQADLSDAALVHYAESMGADSALFNQCVKRESVAQRVGEDIQDGQEIGIDETPTLFVNGERVRGDLAYQRIAHIIDMGIER
jgi:protein-disulfide isomerase